MGKGNAADGAAAHQVPRLTAMLRAFLDSASNIDVGKELELRNEMLRELRDRPAGDGPESSFADRVLGSSAHVSKAARKQLDGFLKAVGAALGLEQASEELQDSAGRAWEALKSAPGRDEPAKRRVLAANLFRPHRQRIEQELGPVQDKDFDVLLAAAWQLQELAASTAASPSPRAFPSPPGPQGQPAAFGDDIAFHFPDERDPEEPAEPSEDGFSDSITQLHRGDGGGQSSMQDLLQMFAPEEASSLVSTSTQAPVYRDPDDPMDAFGPKRPNAPQIGAAWLHHWVNQNTMLTGQELDDSCLGVACALLGAKSGDEAAAELFNLLGDGAFDAIKQLLTHQKVLVATLRSQIAAEMRKQAPEGHSGPAHGAGVSVTSQSQKLQEKLARKERRRGPSRGGPSGGQDAELAWLLDNGMETLVEADQMKLRGGLHGDRIQIGNLDFKIARPGEGSKKVNALPAGTARKMHKGYEEITVPAVKQASMGDNETLVAIATLPEWAQTAFQGYKHLNRIQSRIFPTAFTSNENLLVCAPTGAGKTNIAMIAVLHEVAQHLDARGRLQRDEFKVVYVAPMKALAAEVTGAFSKRLQPLGLSVRELTGDMQLTQREMAETHMIVTTPEKWDVITRKGGDVAAAAAVRLLIMDEVHLLNDERGAVIETLIARTQRTVEASQSMIRIVGLSATLPNYTDVAAFLGVNVDTGLFFFDASYRPVPLEM